MSTPSPKPTGPGPMPPGTLTRDQLDAVITTVLDNNPGMERDLAARIVAEGIKFVVAGAKSPTKALAPSRVVDEGWHALILHTQLYADLCARHGRFVHHHPGYDPENFDPNILARTQETIELSGYTIDVELWAGPRDGRIPVAANCQHSPGCQVKPMPKPEYPCRSGTVG